MRRLGRDTRGYAVFWMLGLAVMLLFLGGISLDLWRAFSERRALASLADAAALAGAGEIVAETAREGDVRLDPARAEARALEVLDRDPERYVARRVRVDPDRITVWLEDTVEFTLLKMFMPSGPFTVTVEATGDALRSGR